MPDDPKFSLVVFGDTSGFTPAAKACAQVIEDFLSPITTGRRAKAKLVELHGRHEARLLKLRNEARLAEELVRHQRNMEAIAQLALPQIIEGARPQDVESDWFEHFFDRARLVSNEEMRRLWSKLLAAEMNSPGAVSRKALEVVSALDKRDAEHFTAFCTFVWKLEGIPMSLVYEPVSAVLERVSLVYSDVLALADAGLLRVQLLDNTSFNSSPREPIHYEYYGHVGTVMPPRVVTAAASMQTARPATRLEERTTFSMGRVSLTRAGQELAQIADGRPDFEYMESVKVIWEQARYAVS